MDFNIFEGMEVTGIADVTISRGAVVWEDGKLHTKSGHGKYIPRPCWGEVFDGIEEREKTRNPLNFKIEREPYTGAVFVPKL